jgi:hypothetical protein
MGTDYILQVIEQIMKIIRALLNKKDEASQQEMDELLNELSGLNNDLLYMKDPYLLASILRTLKDDNRLAMLCVLMKERDEKWFEKVIQELAVGIDIKNLESTVRILFEEKIKV